jgi:hypothetical protein
VDRDRKGCRCEERSDEAISLRIMQSIGTHSNRSFAAPMVRWPGSSAQDHLRCF